MKSTRKRSHNAKKNARRRILLLADFAYVSAKAVASGIIRFMFARSDLDFMILGGHPSNADERYFLKGGVDGVISTLGANHPTLRKLLAMHPRCPVVFASVVRDLANLRGTHSAAVVCDHGAIAKAAASLLMRHGMSEFAYVGARLPSGSVYWDAERRSAFSATLASLGCSAHIYRPPMTTDADAESASLAEWLKSLPKPCGVFASYDQRAMHVLNICRAEGIRVPEQIQVIGADNEEWICEHISPTLTSVEPDFEKCGRMAAETLIRIMDGENYDQLQIFGVKRVVERMSTTDLHGAVNRAVRARRFVNESIGEGHSAADIAARLGCSSRLLQLNYKSVYGRTLQDDLVEARLERVRRLLADTTIPICLIPERVGLDSPNHLMRLFKHRTGMTMLQFRRNLRSSASAD